MKVLVRAFIFLQISICINFGTVYSFVRSIGRFCAVDRGASSGPRCARERGGTRCARERGARAAHVGGCGVGKRLRDCGAAVLASGLATAGLMSVPRLRDGVRVCGNGLWAVSCGVTIARDCVLESLFTCLCVRGAICRRALASQARRHSRCLRRVPSGV